MLITVSRISPKGDTQILNAQAPWLIELLNFLLPDTQPDPASVTGKLQINNYDGTVDIRGTLAFAYSPPCDRCGHTFAHQEKIPMTATIAPVEKAGPDADFESDLNEDLGFAFYKNDQFDLSAVCNDIIGLALPLKYLCKNDCKGLCPDCGADLNTESCACAAKRVDPRLQVLANFKIKD